MNMPNMEGMSAQFSSLMNQALSQAKTFQSQNVKWTGKQFDNFIELLAYLQNKQVAMLQVFPFGGKICCVYARIA